VYFQIIWKTVDVPAAGIRPQIKLIVYCYPCNIEGELTARWLIDNEEAISLLEEYFSYTYLPLSSAAIFQRLFFETNNKQRTCQLPAHVPNMPNRMSWFHDESDLTFYPCTHRSHPLANINAAVRVDPSLPSSVFESAH